MIPPTMKTPDYPEDYEDGRIYIDRLAEVINRMPNTIRRWESDGRLPKNLVPRRGKRNWRYWTRSQIEGPRGIIAWMERNEMHPGRYPADAKKEAAHIEKLRQPKRKNRSNSGDE